MKANDKINIAIVDDSKADARILQRFLLKISYWKIESHIFYNQDDLLNTISTHFDIIFIDYLLGDIDGIELIKKLKKKQINSSFILLTGFGNEKIAIETLRVGATDYLNKNDLNIEIVAKTIRHAIERQKDEEKIKFTQNILENVIAKTQTVFIILDIQGFLLDANNVFVDLIQLPDYKLILGRHISDWIPLEHQEHFKNILEQITSIGSFENEEIIFVDNQNEKHYLLVNGVVLEKKKEKLIYLIARDISQRKKYEQELKLAKIKAEEADRLKSAFLANLSHEIRTPLNAITGFSSLIIDETTSTTQRHECAKYIQESAETLINLITDIVEISKIVSRQVEITLSKTYVNRILDDLFLKFSQRRVQLGKNGIEISLKKSNPSSDFNFQTDSYRLKQVLNNLIDNALKFTERGMLEFGYSLKNQNEIEFFVQDTGIGISKEKLNIIFEWFRKAGDTESKLYRGAGIGLTISYSLVGLLGGELNVRSEENKGSLFWFRLPLKGAENKFQNKVIEKEKAPKRKFSNKTILIAEDEETNFSFLKIALEKQNIKVIRAKNGEEAINLCSNKIDLILMDIKMPIMDGYQATKLIKEKNPSIPIIAQTAYALDNEKQQILDAGCDDYISKPVTFSKLMEILQKFLL